VVNIWIQESEDNRMMDNITRREASKLLLLTKYL